MPPYRTDHTCVFCGIVSGLQPARIVHEDEHTVAFLALPQAVEGHTLVIPKWHAVDIWDIPRDVFARVAETTHLMAERLRTVLEPDGLNLLQSNREEGWQTVYHLHVHLLPRRQGDSLLRPFPRPMEIPDEKDIPGLAELAERIRAAGSA